MQSTTYLPRRAYKTDKYQTPERHHAHSDILVLKFILVLVFINF